ncbi:hypothetical protein VKT23_006491 [Stygiomarasmius scandens]|uniref:Acetyl-CoA synthetase-like protein n=1 Tax=Marasmiellus scandens TaxID=2682957 RepID=A0ABR1JTM4_9AGAR
MLPQVYTAAQAQNCSTFSVPPLDGSVLNGELIDWHIDHSKDHKFAVLVAEGDDENVYSTFAELGEAVHALANYILSSIPSGPLDPSTGKPEIIAIFAALDPLVYATTILAINRAGFQPFPISPRNSQPALVHLLTATRCKYIFAATPSSGAPTAMESLSEAVLDEMVQNGAPLQTLHPYSPNELFPRLLQRPVPPFVPNPNFTRVPPLSQLLKGCLPSNPTPEDLKTHPWMLIHSSGSTKFPKPIYISQASGLQWLAWPWSGESDIAGKVLGTLATPSFHAMGVAMHVGAPLTSGAQSAFYLPSPKPLPPLTPKRFLEGLTKSKAAYSVILPSFLKLWSEDESGKAVEVLKRLEGCCYGAGPLSKSVGDKLVAAGVNLQNAYGLYVFLHTFLPNKDLRFCRTETGVLFIFFPKQKPGYDWQYGRFARHVKPRFVPQEEGKAVLQVLDCETHNPAVVNVVEKIDGEEIRGFDTNDILEEHPVKKGYYRIVGRADDQIMMANGEKTNPGPLELIISSSPLISGCFMFGRSRTQAGVAVEPRNPLPSPQTEESIAAFRTAVFPVIERANALAPQHSRIFKELILITDPEKKGPLPRTPKGDVQRKKAEEMYESEIKALYEEVESKVQEEWARPPLPEEGGWKEEGIRAFVGRVVKGTVGSQGGEAREVDPERDLFAQGCDSLQATYVRQAILSALNQFYAEGEGSKRLPKDYMSRIPNNFVYEHPTQRGIEEVLIELVGSGSGNGSAAVGQSTQERKVKAMRAMVDKYTRDLPPSPSPSVKVNGNGHTSASQGEAVLITGTTGTLGTYILSNLLQDSRVVKVYALNRGKPGSSSKESESYLVSRQKSAFVDKGLSAPLLVSSLESGKLVLLEGNTSEPYLGLTKEVYKDLAQGLTTIIANAWTLNFAMTLGGFESHVKGVRALVDLGIASSAIRGNKKTKFIFSSSVSTVSGWKDMNELIPERELDPEYALGTGYGESKWVAEQTLISAAQRTTSLDLSILRIGQLSGSRVNGSWNVTDWVPQIVQSGVVLGKLPTFPEYLGVSWLPVDVAADAFMDVIFTTKNTDKIPYRYLNLVHINPVSWHTIFTSISQTLPNIPLVPYSEWYNSLVQISSKSHAAEKVSAVKLVDFFASGMVQIPEGVKREAMGMGMMQTGVTEMICHGSVGKAGVLERRDVEGWVGYWKKHGMFNV